MKRAWLRLAAAWLCVVAATGCGPEVALLDVNVETEADVPPIQVLSVLVQGASGSLFRQFTPNPGPSFALPVLLPDFDVTDLGTNAIVNVDGLDDDENLLASGNAAIVFVEAEGVSVTVTLSTGMSSFCGDGVVDGTESCDGDDLGGQDCVSLGFAGGGLSCSASCSFDTANCIPATCGNGFIDPGEMCDGADLGGWDCVLLGLGFTGGTLACDPSCQLDTSGCVSEVCGNGVIDPGETCDGADLGGEDCQTLGFASGMLACDPSCSFDTSGCAGYFFAASLGLDIPADDPGGVFDTRIFTSPTCTISDVNVDVDVSHTWIGDVTLWLESPAGTLVTLHNLSGTNGVDIVGNYPGTLPVDGPGALSDFVGDPTNGTWRLHVSDAIVLDVGRLNIWGLNFTCAPAGLSAPSLPIPDNNPIGVIDSTAISESCTISDVTIDLDVTHTWQGDLAISLTGPGGTVVWLHSNSGGPADDIVGNYPATLSVDGPGALGDFVGQDSSGAWTLAAFDFGPADLGTLNSWGVNITCQDTVPAVAGVPENIPDADLTGIVDTIGVYGPPCPTAATVNAHVELLHPFIDQLVVELTSPAGTVVRLHDQSGGAAPDLIGTYPTTLSVDGPGSLLDFVGEPIEGAWRMTVNDGVGSGSGTLNDWSLSFTCM